MDFTMKESTVDEGSLCSSCINAILIQNQRGGLIRHCRILERDLPHPVETCNVYRKKGTSTLYEMNQIAWIIKAPKAPAGFIPPADRRDTKPPKYKLNPVTGDIDYEDGIEVG